MNTLRSLAATGAVVAGLFAGTAGAQASDMDIVDTAVAAGQFETLAAALTAAGLVEALKGPGPFTVFAPTDAAFGKLPEGTLDTLLMPENRDQLTAILTYHVVPGKVTAADVVSLNAAETLNGQSIRISVDGDTVMIDGASVEMADVEATNGVIHVIDTVLIPPSE
ncbi:fasciclin domain-containing protein [Pelagibacterium halotolerans]|uniref:fasciclin domain-containing protein n=1 Tax=Pelagibacterium halotolerans TaxID=531813 RepID=UPI00384EA4FA